MLRAFCSCSWILARDGRYRGKNSFLERGEMMTMKAAMSGIEATEVVVVSSWRCDLPCSKVETIL